MSKRLLNVYLDQQTSPKVIESAGKDWIEFGEAEYRNQYPQFLNIYLMI